MELYSHKDVDKKALKGARIAVLGYGSQGRAHALNLKDSGFDVVVGVRKGGASWKQRQAGRPGGRRARRRGRRRRPRRACWCPTWRSASSTRGQAARSAASATLLFAHGFNIHFKQIKPRKDLDVVLIAPKGPGDLVRRQYQQGRGVPCLIAVAQDATGTRQAPRAGLRARHRRHARRRARDHLRRGDRDRPVRRAGRAVRRRHRARGQGLRDAGRGRLPARGRLLRVPARAEAHRRPAARGRPRPRCTSSSARPPSTAT